MQQGSTVLDIDRARVLITGASSGVGEATAALFSARGATVALLGRRASELERVQSRLSGASIAVPVDVSDEESVIAAVHRAANELGGIDVVINAAGVAVPAEAEHITGDAWRTVIDTNLSGTFYVSREAIPYLRDSGGCIVNVASDLATMGASGLVHYSASKAGVVGLTRGLAVELAPRIRVNAVCPGPIDTPMMRRGLNESADPVLAMREKELSVPLERLASAEEIAKSIYFLAIDGTFATGTALSVDGGTSAA
ncbi:NAD(P)-dependent dehydrogenase (short-subunit alcohol dehydrogenase family) [Leucobacter luti]|uniref:NAD(P)-dependent dehydrogenase (Short-subunit alcohol dehydrogenase family) n=1 Tax=Leucobacter luti TaxID=340320 RepID=A0A4R6RSN1_9MICO|nr:SDR family NAD(P)-dependent oxidoreductase [Leucobacter luti]TDP89754.1 NAD(P)-dependent dehydrogenase (short-subunit alcohol dehydrogenase family) [Leucobacter luti]